MSIQRLLGQHRECCALRGNGWGKKHATVNYVFKHHPYYLIKYHLHVINEMIKRNINVDKNWCSMFYRGKYCKEYSFTEMTIGIFEDAEMIFSKWTYPEHDDKYLQECLDLLEQKGEHIEMEKQNEKSS